MTSLRLASLFTDHVVLQRNQHNPLWGWDEPGQSIVVTVEGAKFEKATLSTSADSEGRFEVTLPVLPGVGPYRIHVKGSREKVITDVAVGEVWLASGQSNMEWPLSQSANAEAEVALAKFPGIRMVKVANRASATPEETFEGEWKLCEPSQAADFSAVGYYFARAVHERLGVPVGIINASWGGTFVEAWTSLEGLHPVMPELAEDLAEMARQAPRIDEIRDLYDEQVRAWERASLPADPGNLGMLDGWANTDFDDSHWKTMELPRYWQNAGLQFNGVVWFRREIEVPKSWAGKELRLTLGAIDDFDQTYFNGVLIGEHPDGTPGAYQIKRDYQVPGYLVRPGRNVVSVRVFDHCGQGGFAGLSTDLTLSKSGGGSKVIPLSGTWRYAVELEIPLVSMQVFKNFPPPPKILAEQHAPAALFHGMIAPLIPFKLAGFLFYQGENNVPDYGRYRDRLVAMIRDYRTRFGQGTLPFAFVQLAGYKADVFWPFLREAQEAATHEPRCYMATAIDIGEAEDIHPRNKRAIGERLAALALANAYGDKNVVCYGPKFTSFEIEGNWVRVHFEHAEGLKTSDGAEQVLGFAIAGRNGVFVEAEARIDGPSVVIASGRIEGPSAVRYAWKDYQPLNLVNGAGLPALPFRTDGSSPV